MSRTTEDLQACRYCDAEMVWATVEPSGKSIPLDPDPDPDGNLELASIEPGRRPRVRHVGTSQERTGMPRYRAHFVTCPDQPKKTDR